VKRSAITTFLFALLLGANQALAAQPVLHVANWNDYIDPEVISAFEKENNVSVEYTPYASNEEAEALLNSDAPLDVLVSAYEFLPTYIRQGKLASIGAKDMSAYQEADTRVLSRLASKDALRLYAVPYLWGNIGIAMNREKVEAVLGEPAP